jgi:[ribosomal protein S18]-alanine N-acetyltransferase
VRRMVEPPAEEVAVRCLVAEDLPAVLELQSRAFTHPWSAELLQREMTHEWSTILVAEASGTQALVGFLIYWLVHDELHILNLATDPKCRRKGTARRLMHEALQTGRSRKCSMATLEVRRGNVAAIELYKSLGFRAVGVRPNYYVDEREDAIVMIADL